LVKVSVLLPALNEGENLPRLAEALLRFPEVGQLIVVDDASVDRTPELWERSPAAKDPRAIFLRNHRRVGLAASILQALGRAEMDFVLVRDSDWNHDLATFPLLLASAERGHALTVASRYLEDAGRIGRWNDLLSLSLNFFLSLPGRRRITDWTYGYFLIRRELLLAPPPAWVFRGRGEYSVRLFRWLLRHFPRLSIAEVKTVVQARGAGLSTTRPFRHGLIYLRTLLEKVPARDKA
jgi:glycosyltransferase involved in cell wall biosynthesis